MLFHYPSKIRHKIQNRYEGRANSTTVNFEMDASTFYTRIFCFFLFVFFLPRSIWCHIFFGRGRITSWDEKVSVKVRLCQFGSLLVKDTPLCGVVLEPGLYTISLSILWSHLWRIVDTSSLGEHVWSAAAVNMTVVTAEVSSTRTLWLKNRSLNLIPRREVSVLFSLTHFHPTSL